MLKNIISPQDCAKCQFCCSFRRVSLEFTPFFLNEIMPELREKYPSIKFKEITPENFTVDIENNYPPNDDGTAEALCPFNVQGCILSEKYKPFQCKIWPLQIMKHGEKIAVVLMPTCPVMSKIPVEKIRELVTSSGALKKIWDYVNEHPEVIVNFEEGHEIIDER